MRKLQSSQQFQLLDFIQVRINARLGQKKTAIYILIKKQKNTHTRMTKVGGKRKKDCCS